MQREMVVMESGWRYQPDPEDSGEMYGYVDVDYDAHLWREVSVPCSLEQGHPDLEWYMGIGWYRHTFHVPEAWRGKRVVVHFDSVNDFLKYKEQQNHEQLTTDRAAAKKGLSPKQAENKSPQKEDKKLKNKVLKLERDIEDLEQQIAGVEQEMTDIPDRAPELYSKYEGLKKELDERMKSWEEASGMLDS